MLPSLGASPDFHLKPDVLPHMEVEKAVQLGRCARPSAVQSLCSHEFELWFIFTLLVLCGTDGK